MADPIGSAPGIIVGVGVGAAASTALEAAVELPRQKVWADNPNKILDPAVVARLVAQGAVALGAGRDDARREGFTSEKFDQLVYLAQTVPPIAEALDLWRRNHISDALFAHVLTKNGLDVRYVQPILDSKEDERLAPAQVALGIVRSLLDSHGLLVGENDTTGGVIAPTPVSPIDPREEVAAWGIDVERLRIMVNEIGLPMALQQAASAVFRGIIEKPDFYLAVAQGDTRPAWADAIFEQARQIPSVTDYVQLHLRGWIDEAAMNEGVARHGMSPEDARRIYLRSGRPAAPGQMATAAAREIDGPDGRPLDREQFLKGIAESDIRPEWGPMLWETRFLYPPLFQITRLVQAGAITADTAAEWARKDRYPPEVVEPLHAYWSQPATGPTTTAVTKAQNQLWTATHRSFVAGESDEATVRATLPAAGVPADQIDGVLTAWAHESALVRKQLSSAQIKKAFQKMATNPATGAAWTRPDAILALVDQGWSEEQADALLNIP